MDSTTIAPEHDLNVEKWAEITVEKWQFAIAEKNLFSKGRKKVYEDESLQHLLNSFTATVHNDADGKPELIDFAFNYFLRMIDAGVGKGVDYSEAKELKLSRKVFGIQKGNRRTPKLVYSKILYSEVMRLGELLTQRYAATAAKTVADAVNSV